ncbi:hypothetical protein GF340_03995 [Candidatus Peregrinibacteria bacterium]|nr:hypothetical protein [Candidatus Peregrinibacteria bacterium]
MNTTPYSKKSGVSTLIALGMITAILLFSLLVSNVIVTSIRQSANVNRANEAFYAAEGALEQGLLANQQAGVGESLSDDTDYASLGGTAGSRLQAGYEVKGQVPVKFKYGSASGYEDMYGIPTPGTGDAGTLCDPVRPNLGGSDYDGFIYLDGNGDEQKADKNIDADLDPCNWNKIYLGDTVTIPLYYTDTNGNAVNIITSPSDEFILRIKTPCEDGSEWCASSSNRYSLDESNDDPTYGTNEPVVSWQITGKTPSGAQTVLDPLVQVEFDTLQDTSTIITEKKINEMSNISYETLYLTSVGIDLNKCRGPIKYFLLDALTIPPIACPRKHDDWSFILNEPLFKFSVVSSLDGGINGNIPFLEYQIISNTNVSLGPVSDTQKITAEGISGEFKQILEVKQPQESGLLEYVIQQ